MSSFHHQIPRLVLFNITNQLPKNIILPPFSFSIFGIICFNHILFIFFLKQKPISIFYFRKIFNFIEKYKKGKVLSLVINI